jgi:hypothetical protein
MSFNDCGGQKSNRQVEMTRKAAQTMGKSLRCRALDPALILAAINSFTTAGTRPLPAASMRVVSGGTRRLA